MLNDLVDESDPDLDLPNIVHAFQTAERIREEHPDKDWFHLVGLIHDLGKVMAFYGEPQWCVVGDTFPVGCRSVFSTPCRGLIRGIALPAFLCHKEPAQGIQNAPDMGDILCLSVS